MGRGQRKLPFQNHLAAYVLHLTVSNILFLAKADDEIVVAFSNIIPFDKRFIDV